MNKKKIENNKIHSIGNYLKLHRKKIGLSKQDIADYLCLKVSIIKKIEEDNYNDYDSLIFIYGYIRSYARILNLPKDKIEKMIIKNEKSIHLNHDSLNFKKNKLLKQKNKKYNKWILVCTTLSIFLFIIIFIIGYIYFKNNNNNEINKKMIDLDQQHAELKID